MRHGRAGHEAVQTRRASFCSNITLPRCPISVAANEPQTKIEDSLPDVASRTFGRRGKIGEDDDEYEDDLRSALLRRQTLDYGAGGDSMAVEPTLVDQKRVSD
jgi:hypothetical protein